jgi:hypothetical protein
LGINGLRKILEKLSMSQILTAAGFGEDLPMMAIEAATSLRRHPVVILPTVRIEQGGSKFKLGI